MENREDIYEQELQVIEKIKVNLYLNVKYPYIVILHKKDYEKLKENNLAGNNNKFHDNQKKDIIKKCSESSIIDEDKNINIKIQKNNSNQDIIIDNILPGKEKEIIESFINDKDKYIPNESLPVLENENINNDNNEKKLPQRQKNKESVVMLSKVINNHYTYYDKYLPDRQNIENFKIINKNLKTKYKFGIIDIIEYYNLYKKYLDNNKEEKECSNTFYEFIEYNKAEFCVRYFCHFYEKVKKCYNFIDYFLKNNISENKIIKLMYKSNLTYNILYKIKGEEYEKLKLFFYEKIELLGIKNKKDKIISETKLERKTQRESLLNYIGNKHDYTEIINSNININTESCIYDLFSGSCSTVLPLDKLYPNNRIILNDINEYITNFYDQVKNNNENLLLKIKELNTGHNIEKYENILTIYNTELTNIEKAAWYYILNKIAYNGKISTNEKGEIKVYSYNKKTIKINESKFINFKDFLAKNELQNKCVLNNMDYWLNRINNKDLVILDPPYDILGISNNHYKYNFNRKEQENLCVFINKLIEKKVKVLLFNGDTLFIKKLYKNLNMKTIKSNTSINRKCPYKELLFFN